MTLYLLPYMDTIQTVPMNLSDLISLHSMFQLLHAKKHGVFYENE